MKTLDEQIEEMRAKVKTKWGARYSLVQTIQAASMAVFGAEKESFFNGERTRHISYARMASMAICRDKTKLPLESIGKLHGGLDHTAVSYAVNKAKNGKHEFNEGVQEILRLIES